MSRSRSPRAMNGILTSKSELDDINRRLKQNGVDPQIGEQAKLQELWHLLMGTEAELVSARQTLSEAEGQHAVEMQEVESYMEQVRHLSEERDALTQEFETENEQLKRDLGGVREEMADSKREVAQMLIQEGFTDLVDGTPSEAIAYLLVERTRTMDELRETKRKAASSPWAAITNSKQIQEVLDKERKLMGEEMKVEKDAVRKMKDGMEQIYAKELNRVKADNKLKVANLESQKHRLEQEARQHQQKCKDLEFEMQRLKKSLEREKKDRREEVDKLAQQVKDSTRDPSQLDSSQLREAKKKLEMEVTSTKYRLKTGEEDKNKLNQRVKELTQSLDTEKKRRSSYEGTIIKLKTVVDRNKKVITNLEDEKQTLSEEKSALQMRIGFLEKDLQELKEQEKSLLNQTNSLKSEQTVIDRQEGEIKSLREETAQQALKLQRAMVSLETERRKCLELGEKLNSTEEKWEQIVRRYKSNEQDLTNKLDKLTRDLDLSKSELDANHQRISRIHQEHDKQMDGVKSETQILREQLLQERSLSDQADRHRDTIKELEVMVEELKKDRDVLARELQVMIGKEQKHKEGLMAAEATAAEIKRLEEETNRLEAQLESSVMKQSSLVEELSEEKRKNQKLQDQLNFSQETLKIAEESTDHLKESIGRKSAELVKQYDWSKDSQAKLGSKVRSLERELDEAKAMTQRDKSEVAWRLEREEKRVKELEDMLTEKKEELAELRKESGRALVGQTRSEERVQEESRLRQDVEQRNKVLEEEMTKQWTQLKDLMARLTAAESAKQEVEVQLDKQTNEMRQRYSEIQQVQAETDATTSTLSLVQQRAQAAERKIPELQQQLDEKSLRLQATEVQLRDLTATKLDLRSSKDDINRLKVQLHEERIEKSLLNQQLEDAKQQVAACLEREDKIRHENSDMKHRLLQTQSKLYATEDKSKSVEDMHSLAEQGKKSLLDQVSSLQLEVQRLQTELLQTGQRLEAQVNRYEEHKTHHKNKIQQAREIFTRHKSVLADSLMKLQQDLNTTNAELQKEQNNRENLQRKHDSLLEEHRKLLAIHSDAEEAVRDQNRNVSTMDYRVKYLERENSVLQDRIDTLSRQRVAMEKLIREYRLEKQKQEIDRSLLASSPAGVAFPPSSPLGTLNSTFPKTTLTSGLGLSQSPSYISTLDARSTNNGYSLRMSQPLSRMPAYSPTQRESLRSPELSYTQSSDNDAD